MHRRICAGKDMAGASVRSFQAGGFPGVGAPLWFDFLLRGILVLSDSRCVWRLMLFQTVPFRHCGGFTIWVPCAPKSLVLRWEGAPLSWVMGFRADWAVVVGLGGRGAIPLISGWGSIGT